MKSAPGWSDAALDAEFGPLSVASADDKPSDATPSRTLLRWITEFEDDVRAGRVSLVEVCEAAISDLENDWPLCPHCSVRPVRDVPATARAKGLCKVCWMQRLADAQRERLAGLIATRDYNLAKKECQRERDDQGIEVRPRQKCAIPACDEIADRRGLCGLHRIRIDRNGFACPRIAAFRELRGNKTEEVMPPPLHTTTDH